MTRIWLFDETQKNAVAEGAAELIAGPMRLYVLMRWRELYCFAVDYPPGEEMLDRIAVKNRYGDMVYSTTCFDASNFATFRAAAGARELKVKLDADGRPEMLYEAAPMSEPWYIHRLQQQ